MSDTAFRKIDIDQFDEDVVLEEELYEQDTRDPNQALNDVKGKATAVRGLLSKGDTAGALATVLTEPPYGANAEVAKTQNLQTLLLILNSTKSTGIPDIVKSLDYDGQDTLMKYLYKAMALPGVGDVNSSQLLTWHEKLTEVAGTGCIVRAMTDRRKL